MRNTKKETVLQGYEMLEDIRQKFLDKCKQNDVLHQKDAMDAMEHLAITDTDFDDLFQWFFDNGIEVKNRDDDVDLTNDDALIATGDDDDISFLGNDTDEEGTPATNIENLEQPFANSSYTEINGPVKMCLKEVGRAELLDPEEEPEIARCIQADDEETRKKLISTNLHLVISVARKYAGHGILSPDLTQGGNMDLVRAVEKSDYTKGFKSPAYAT